MPKMVKLPSEVSPPLKRLTKAQRGLVAFVESKHVRPSYVDSLLCGTRLDMLSRQSCEELQRRMSKAGYPLAVAEEEC